MTPLQQAMEAKQISPQELALRTDSHINSVRIWMSGQGLPGGEKRQMLEKLFPGIVDQMTQWRKQFTVLN